MTIHHHTKYKLIVGLLVGIFFIETGMQSRCTRNEKSEKEEEKVPKKQLLEKDSEKDRLEKKLKVIAAIYEAVDAQEIYGKGKKRSLAIALYHQKGKGLNSTPHVVVALSGQDGELIDTTATENINSALEADNKKMRELAINIPSAENKITIEYTLVPLDSTFINKLNDRTILDGNGKKVGKILEEGFVTLKQDPQPYNLRDSDAEAALIRHINQHASLQADIVVFSVRAICGSCGGVKYAPTSAWYTIKNLRDFRMEGGGQLLEQKVKDREGFGAKVLTADYVRRGLLGQLAEQIVGKSLYAVEFKPSLTEGKVYKWDCQTLICKKQVYQQNGVWIDVPEVN